MSEEALPFEENKPELEEIQDDFDSFNELERSFHQVVQDLVSDHSLNNFRQEYEKVHRVLVISHEHNTALVEKCKELNNEILANANKISSVMTLSQNDQRTIAGLRHEFEKAWKLVEVSQEKENKSRDIIEGLKQEIANLTKLVDQGGQMAFSQENSLQEIKDTINALKKEIAAQQAQIESMEKDLKISKESESMIKANLEKFTNDFHDLTTQVDAQKAQTRQISSTNHEAFTQIKNLKDEYTNMEDQMRSIKKQKKNHAYHNIHVYE